MSIKNVFSASAFWIFWFLIVNIFIPKEGGGNPASRLAALANFAEEKSFAIDRYIVDAENPATHGKPSWTADWARAPDGHYYSNKAPGQIILALPFYLVWDKILVSSGEPSPRHGDVGRQERDALRFQAIEQSGFLLSLFTQVLPLCAVALWALSTLRARKVSTQAQNFFLAAALFANTAALLANTFFSHALSAALALAAVLAIEPSTHSRSEFGTGVSRRGSARYFSCGLFCGLAVLTDYSAALLLFAIVLYLFIDGLGFKRLVFFTSGGIIPGIAWLWYHIKYFGGPLSIALHHQNPVFRDKAESEAALWGVIDILPSLDTTVRLIKGSSRGLLMTQSWVLVFLVAIIWVFVQRKTFLKNARSVVSNNSGLFVSLLFFAGLFWMNASFGGWDGGAGPGPRYLSLSFALLAYAAALRWDSFSLAWQRGLMLALLPSLILFAFAYSTTVLVPVTPLWSYYLHTLFEASLFKQILFLAVSLSLIYSWQRGILGAR